jgi:transposase-like protein
VIRGYTVNIVETEDMPTANPRHRYDEAFKRKVVQMLVESQKSATAIAQSIGIERTILCRWKKKFGHEFVKESRKTNGKMVRLNDFESLKAKVESLEGIVDQLRSVVKKSLVSRYVEDPGDAPQ